MEGSSDGTKGKKKEGQGKGAIKEKKIKTRK